MGDDVGESTASGRPSEYKFTSIKSPNYRLEFINGALSNVTPRGEIVCDFHFEFKDMPDEQSASVAEDGKAILLPMQESNTLTRDIKFGIVMNVQFAKDLVILLNGKISDCENVLERGKKGDRE